MKNGKRIAYVTRDSIMKLLSDDEVARVTTAETAESLLHGDEYIDLEHIDLGVCRTNGKIIPMETMLARKAVREETWNAIL